MSGFKRKLHRELLAWKQSTDRKPLLIRGARQVGKSTLIHQFGEEYDCYVPINLERKVFRDLFEQLDDVHELWDAILLESNQEFKGGEALLFLDEIQESPKAICLLRYFYEDKPELHVVAAGSLLEFAMKNVASFPVGRVENLVLHPFDFEEFLEAAGQTAALKQWHQLPVKPLAHDKLMDLFHTFAVVGGMPAAIKQYVEQQSMAGLGKIYDALWQGYKDDLEKYATNPKERKVIRHVIDTAPKEKDRIAFEGFGQSNYRSREVGESLRMLNLSRVIRLVYPATELMPPISEDLKKRPRLQFLDTALMCYSLGIQVEMIKVDDLSDFLRGKIIQHLATQELIAQHHQPSYKPHFWVREKANSSAEVDLVFERFPYLIPIEVKSGKQGKLRSLHQFMENCGHPYAVRLLGNKLSVEQVKTPQGTPYLLMNMPYYLAAKLPAYVDWFIENHQLEV